MSVMDQDGDGTVDYEEFIAFLTGKIEKTYTDDQLLESF